MKEAAGLLRDEKLSVSETGYQIGFEKLSHFARLSEKYIGKKPKKYNLEFMQKNEDWWLYKRPVDTLIWYSEVEDFTKTLVDARLKP